MDVKDEDGPACEHKEDKGYGVITKTCPCSMKQYLKLEKMIFLDVKM